MSELKENQLTVIDENGNETLCQILFTFESETTGKKFVVFYPIANLEDDDDQIELSAAMYTEGVDGNGELHEITEESDWEEVENAIEEFDRTYSGHCGCGCDHECDDCEEDCEDECEGGCCCHHEE